MLTMTIETSLNPWVLRERSRRDGASGAWLLRAVMTLGPVLIG